MTTENDSQAEQTFDVRDRREPGWFWIDNTLLDKYGSVLGPGGIAVYCALARHAHNDKQTGFPGYATLAELTGMSRSWVRRAIAKLVKLGLIRKTRRFRELANGKRRHKSNLYTLMHPKHWQDQTLTKGGMVTPTIPMVTETPELDCLNYDDDETVLEKKRARGWISVLGYWVGIDSPVAEKLYTPLLPGHLIAWRRVAYKPGIYNVAGFLVNKLGADPFRYPAGLDFEEIDWFDALNVLAERSHNAHAFMHKWANTRYSGLRGGAFLVSGFPEGTQPTADEQEALSAVLVADGVEFDRLRFV